VVNREPWWIRVAGDVGFITLLAYFAVTTDDSVQSTLLGIAMGLVIAALLLGVSRRPWASHSEAGAEQ
jgi:hypothetical protein